MKKYILTILTALCLCGCEKHYLETNIINFENKSSHTIEINAAQNFSRSCNCIIKPNDTYSYIAIVEPGIGLRAIICPYTIKFDDEIEIDDTANVGHDLDNSNSYSIKTSGKPDTKKYTYTYTYTFTDEDYNRAVAANANAD